MRTQHNFDSPVQLIDVVQFLRTRVVGPDMPLLICRKSMTRMRGSVDNTRTYHHVGGGYGLWRSIYALYNFFGRALVDSSVK